MPDDAIAMMVHCVFLHCLLLPMNASNKICQQWPLADPNIEILIDLFNETFLNTHQTALVCCESEPIYRPAQGDQTLHQIVFAQGFFASALHEIAHWCIAGPKRRLLEDFGYWYEPDGRSAQRQKQFETVEIKPQALEWLFTLACNRRFHFSADNLTAQAGVSAQFQQNVYTQAQTYLTQGMPQDAMTWFKALEQSFRPNHPLRLSDINPHA